MRIIYATFDSFMMKRESESNIKLEFFGMLSTGILGRHLAALFQCMFSTLTFSFTKC